MIPKAELESNAVDFIKSMNQQGVVGLGAIIIFFDMKHGFPVIAGNVPRGQMEQILRDCLRSFSTLSVKTGEEPT